MCTSVEWTRRGGDGSFKIGLRLGDFDAWGPSRGAASKKKKNRYRHTRSRPCAIIHGPRRVILRGGRNPNGRHGRRRLAPLRLSARRDVTGPMLTGRRGGAPACWSNRGRRPLLPHPVGGPGPVSRPPLPRRSGSASVSSPVSRDHVRTTFLRAFHS